MKFFSKRCNRFHFSLPTHIFNNDFCCLHHWLWTVLHNAYRSLFPPQLCFYCTLYIVLLQLILLHFIMICYLQASYCLKGEPHRENDLVLSILTESGHSQCKRFLNKINYKINKHPIFLTWNKRDVSKEKKKKKTS